MSSDNYDVGYKKPPVSSRFQKGVSGNPRGRPKKDQSQATILEEIIKELKKTVTIRENGKIIKVTKMEAMIKNLLASAMKGDSKSISLLMKILGQTKAPDGKELPTQIRVSWMR